MSFPEIGSKAPDFTLQDQDGKSQTLSDYRGSIVLLYFYPKAMTPGCTVQACALRDSKKALKDAGVVVFGVSNDPVSKLARFAERDELNFTLLSDEDHAVSDEYGVWGLKKFMGKEYMGLMRTSFIIDREGRVQHIIDKVKTKTHHDDVLAWVNEHQDSL